MATIFKIETRHLGTVEVDFDSLSPEMQEYLIRYGLKQSIDDAGASPEKGKAGSEERLKAILAGDVPAGGGRRLSLEERCLREVVEAVLRKAGVKATDATKAAKDPEGAIRAATQKKGNFADVWPKIQAKAADLVAERRAKDADLADLL